MPRTSHEDFVVSWMTARNMESVMKETKMSKAAITARATMLRSKGVKLPRLSVKPVLDDLRVAQLNSLVNKYKEK